MHYSYRPINRLGAAGLRFHSFMAEEQHGRLQKSQRCDIALLVPQIQSGFVICSRTLRIAH
jgi:hypothetical protein